MSNIKAFTIEKLNAKLEAFPYQAEAFNALKDMDYCAILHEQGLGKTKIAIDLALYWLKNRDIDSVIIITSRSGLSDVGAILEKKYEYRNYKCIV